MLTAEQVSQYRREGYTLCEEFLHKQEVITLLAEIEQVCKGNTLAQHDSARLEMEPNQASDGTLVRRLYESLYALSCIQGPLGREPALGLCSAVAGA